MCVAAVRERRVVLTGFKGGEFLKNNSGLVHHAYTIHCPLCESVRINRYGRSKQGKQRFRCVACGRQFVAAPDRSTANNPRCPNCRSTMHVYRREGKVIRYRCSGYPSCRTYFKTTGDGPSA
jgi:transposase-like protein